MLLSKYQVLCVLFHDNHLGVRGQQHHSLKHRVLAINPNDLFPSRLLLLKSRTMFRNKMILPYLNFKTVFSYKTSFLDLYSWQNFETIISCRKLTSLFTVWVTQQNVTHLILPDVGFDLEVACVASVSVELSARWRRFSLFGGAKIGASATLMEAAGRAHWKEDTDVLQHSFGLRLAISTVCFSHLPVRGILRQPL